MQPILERIEQLAESIEKMEATLASLVQQRDVREWYTTVEVARLLGKAEFTVREWCRLGRVNAEKRHSGRGKYQAWVISHEELMRLQRDGLLPISKYQPH